MAEPWNSWDSCVDNNTASGWDADVVLSTGHLLNRDQDSSSDKHERNRNNRNDYPKNNERRNSIDEKRNNWTNKNERSDNRNYGQGNDYRNKNDRYNKRNETTKDEKKDNWTDRNSNNWQDKKNDGNRHEGFRNNNKSDNKYNNPVETNFSRGRPHEMHNRNENKSHYNESREKSPNRFRNRSSNRDPKFERYPNNKNTGPESNSNKPTNFFPVGSNSHKKSYEKSNAFGEHKKNSQYETKNERQNQYKEPNSFNNPSRDSSDFKTNQREYGINQKPKPTMVFRNNSGENVNKHKNHQRAHKKEEKHFIQHFQDPPELFTGEGKPVVENDLDDNTSSKFSSKSESVTSSDQHEVEMKILNMIHEFKTTLHLVEIKPSLHVQTEIKGLQKYISLIFEKWNPKMKESKGGSSSSDSESSDSSDENHTKRKSNKNKHNKKTNKRKKSQKEDEKPVNNENGSNITKTGNPNVHKVTEFQENTVNFFNNQNMIMPKPAFYRPPPLLSTPPYPPIHLHNPNLTFGNFPLHPGFVPHDNFYRPVQPNLAPSQLTSPMNQRTSTKKSQNPNSHIKGDKKPNLSSDVLNIVNDVRVSSVTMTKAHIKEMTAALDKLSLIDKNNLNTDPSEDFKNINICMLKVLENETISHDIKYGLLHLLEELFKNTCDEKSHEEVQKLVRIYQTKINESKNKPELKYDDENNTVLEQFKKESNNKSSVQELLAFKDKAKEAMAIHTQLTSIIDDTSSASENETEDDSSEDDNINSDEEHKDQKEDSQDKNSDPRKDRRNFTFSEELGIHCKSFLRNDDSIQEQVNHALDMYNQIQSPEYKSEQKKLMYTIKDMVKKMYPNCILHLFGSRVSNMALPDSDMDIYIDITGQGYCNGAKYEDQQLFVKKIRKLFYQRSDIFSNILGLTKTKVPIIKIHHKVSAINCDLSFKNGISVENTNLLCYYLSLDARVKWLVTAVKLWAHYNHIYASDFFTSHALSWLVLFYLMHMKIVPPVLLLKAHVKPRVIDDWDIATKKLNNWIPAAEPSSGLALFKDFFRFLIDANLQGCVLCTHTGEFLSKESVSDLGLLEDYKNGIFKEYVERIRNSEYTDISARENPSSMPMQLTIDQLCIQDPFEFSKNVSNPVKGKKFEHFNTLCCLTLEQMLA